MKSKSKSNTSYRCSQPKQDKKRTQQKSTKSNPKTNHQSVKKTLQTTLKILQHRLHIQKQPTPPSAPQQTLLTLSQQIYQIINKNIPQKPSLISTRDCSEQSSTTANCLGPTTTTTNTNTDKNQQKSYSNHSHSQSSCIMDYFKDKFYDNVSDEKSVEKRLRAIQALKRTQEFAAKYSSQTHLSVSSIPDIGCDIGGKQVVLGKIRQLHP